MSENVSILEPLILFFYSLKYLNVGDVISMQNARQAVCHWPSLNRFFWRLSSVHHSISFSSTILLSSLYFFPSLIFSFLSSHSPHFHFIPVTSTTLFSDGTLDGYILNGWYCSPEDKNKSCKSEPWTIGKGYVDKPSWKTDICGISQTTSGTCRSEEDKVIIDLDPDPAKWIPVGPIRLLFCKTSWPRLKFSEHHLILDVLECSQSKHHNMNSTHVRSHISWISLLEGLGTRVDLLSWGSAWPLSLELVSTDTGSALKFVSVGTWSALEFVSIDTGSALEFVSIDTGSALEFVSIYTGSAWSWSSSLK